MNMEEEVDGDLSSEGSEDLILNLYKNAKMNHSTVFFESKINQVLENQLVLGSFCEEYPYQDETKVVASLVPDEIIYDIDNYNIRSIECCLLFGDVSGFTELLERYSNAGDGPAKVTQVLNSYIAAMVQETMSHGGDILKFSGDAFLVIYKKSDTVPMRDAVHEAIDCGLIIQKSYGNYTTDVGIVIRVKLIISAGTLFFALIGDDKSSHYLEVGQPIWDIKAADSKSCPGDVLVSHSAWKYINLKEYNYIALDDKNHIKIQGVGAQWRGVEYVRKIPNLQTKSKLISKRIDDSYMIRPAINFAFSKGLKEKLRKFIIKQVMDALDRKEPLDYLTEVREVTVMFMNIVLSSKNADVILNLANQIYYIVCRDLLEFKGQMNKMNMFDKDLMMLAMFGLRGDKDGTEAERALKCAWKCRQEIIQIEGIETLSVGVCSGTTYCGVFGHTLRKEYTVMGVVVNKAARLMMAYPNMITCERQTFLLSKMKFMFFSLKEHKYLKGIRRPGPVYEYQQFKVREKMAIRLDRFPLLERKVELVLYHNLLASAMGSYGNLNMKIINILITKAKRLMGMHRLHEEFIISTPKTIPINTIYLLPDDVQDKYVTLRMLFYPVMGLTEESDSRHIENVLADRLKGTDEEQDLWCLNEIFHVNFPGKSSYEEVYIGHIRRRVLRKLIDMSFFTLWVVMIRKTDYVSPEAWNYIQDISILNKIFFTCQMNEQTIKMKYQNVKTITLGPINKAYHSALACQFLKVRGISSELERLIQAYGGTPGYLEHLLICMAHSNELWIKSVTKKQAYDSGYVLPPNYLFERLCIIN